MSISAQQVLDAVLDAGSFQTWYTWLPPRQVEAAYADQLARARKTAGTSEAVVVGEGRVHGHKVAFIVGEFAFLGGSIGLDTSEAIIRCIRRATAEKLPLLVSPASGGTRMQEGTPAFVAMCAITAALVAHRRAHLPYLVWLRQPTFGGVLASWGSLGHITAAEPGAAIGFLGPRVYSALRGSTFPGDVQVAENLRDHGLIDACIPLAGLRRAAARILDVLGDRCTTGPLPLPQDDLCPDPEDTPWGSVLRSRRKERPGVRQLFADAGVDLVELAGTARGEASPGIVLGLIRLGDSPCVVVGQDRVAQSEGHPLGPGALRVARRGFRLAEDLQLPLVTVVDTPGADLRREAEEGGLSAEIASCLYDLAALHVRSLCFLLGEGAGGAAIALAGTRRVIAARHAWLAALPPEAASMLQYRSAGHEPRIAVSHRMTSAALLEAGIVQRIVDERPDAADEPVAFARRAVSAIESDLRAPC